jgi:hypothetical protein
MEKLTIIMRSVVFNFIFCDIFLKLSILAKTKSGYYMHPLLFFSIKTTYLFFLVICTFAHTLSDFNKTMQNSISHKNRYALRTCG